MRAIVAVAASLVLLGSVITPAVAFADDTPTIHLSETVSPSSGQDPTLSSALHPGDTATFSYNMDCSSLESQCDGFAVTDTIPAPLVLGAIAAPAGVKTTVVKSGNTFTVTFIQPLQDGNTGLDAGHQIGFTATATLPSTASANYDGQTVANPSTATATGVPTVTATASVVLSVPTTRAATITKTFSPSTLVSAPGKTSTIGLAVGNATNAAVDTLTVQDPATLPSTAFTYLGITGLSVGTWPGGANQARVDYYDGTWHTGTFSSTVALPSGVTASSILGIRVVFKKSTGTIAQGGSGVLNIATALRSNVSGLSSNTSVSDTASAFVTSTSIDSPTVTSSANLAITHVSISPLATKTYAKSSILGGTNDEATLVATNGGQYTLTKMVVNEPASGGQTLADQNLGFVGWDNAKIEWPVGATGASVQYLYSGAGGTLASAQAMTEGSAMPLPDPDQTVIGFRVSFTGTMAAGQYATLPFTVSTSAVDADVTETNTMSVDVTTDDGQTDEATASADLTLRTARINTSVDDKITPSKVYSAAGGTTVISLPAQVDAEPVAPDETGGSTVGADSLTVQDPADPASASFWDSFDASAIVATDVPSNVTMSVNYLDASTKQWLPLAGAQDVSGQTTFTYVLTDEQREAAEGLQFVYTPTSGTLPPGFAVQPNVKVALRAGLRSDSGTAPNSSTTDTVTLDNTVESIATSVSTDPGRVTDDADAEVKLLPAPTPGTDGGPGRLPMIDKTWLSPDSSGTKYVEARTEQDATAVLDWGTASQAYHSVVISDTSDATPSLDDIDSSVYDAFNLVSIPKITTDMDPLLTYDEVAAVQFFFPGTGPGTGWVDAAGNPCANAACDGTFPGYTLTATESQNAIGARLIFVESPTRSARIGNNPNAPLVGTGVAPTTDEARSLDLVFSLRDTKRSDGSAVLGTTSGTLYNVADEPGFVSNSAGIDGRDASDTALYTDHASDDIQILDEPIDVAASKSWSDGTTGGSVLGLPPVGTDVSLYPTALLTISGQNTSVAAVNELSLAEPTGGTHPFDYVNITKIDSISVPTGATSSSVVLSPSADYPNPYTVAAAEALSPDDLANATGITVTHDGRIVGSASTTVNLETQLRPTDRATGDPILPPAPPVQSLTVHNQTTASITDPDVLNSDNTTSDSASAQIDIDSFDFGVAAGKSIVADTTSGTNPAIQYDGSSTVPSVTLSGQPTGNVSTTTMTIDDSTPTFWNAYNFTGFGSFSFAAPIDHVEVDALVGVTYVTTPTSIEAQCNGSDDLTDCWYLGTPKTSSTLSLPSTLPSGTTNSDIRGLRFVFTDGDYIPWERPHNPLQKVTFKVGRRTDLVQSADPLKPTTTPVPSDLYTNTTPAPGETAAGIFTNTVVVTAAAASSATDTDPVWTATDQKTQQIAYRHLPAMVKIEKSPAGDWPLGSDIPYTIAVTNTGSGHDKVLSGVVVTDDLPGDSANGPDLVLPTDPDTGDPMDASDAFTYTMTDGDTTEPAPTVTPVLSPANPDGTQRITFTVAGTIPLGWTLTINATLDYRDGLTAYTPVHNVATVTSDQVFDSCDYFSDEAEQPLTTDTATCTSDTTTRPQPSAPLTIVKGVRGVDAGPLDADGNPIPGDDDLGVLKTASSTSDCTTTNPTLQLGGNGYYSYPCVPITRPGGTEQWISQFTNGGNIDLGTIVAIDVLPTGGDTGVVLDSPRGSAWTPTLTSYPAVHGLPNNADYTVEYTDQTDVATARCNGADIQASMGMTASTVPAVLTDYQPCLTNTGKPDDLANRDWQTLPTDASATQLASVVAMKFVINMGDGLAPGGSVDITYDSQTANNIDVPETAANLDHDSIAYNSIAGAAIGRYTNPDPEDLPYPFVSEPRKVGVALATGGIDVLKLDTGSAAAKVEPTQNKLDVSCKSNGVPVLIFDSNGNARSPFTVTPGSPSLIQGLPLYSVCTVSEKTDYGQTTKTIVPSTPIIAEASHTAPSQVGGYPIEVNAKPAFDAGSVVSRPVIQQATVTNDYDNSDFTVTKTIDNGGAVDASGNAIGYTSPTFTASCVFNNGVSNVTTLATTTFTLGNGQSKTFSSTSTPSTPIPVGSVCTVKETNTQKASSDTYVVSANGTSQPSAAGPTATFTVAGNTGGSGPTNTVAFTNKYTVGSLEVDKVVTGDWGAGRTFNFSLACTYTNGASTPVTSTVYSSTFSLSSVTSPTTLTKKIDNLPTGSICTLTETNSAGATKPTITGNAAVIGVTGTATATKTITATNEYDDATLLVTKLVHTSAVDEDGNTDYPAYTYPMSVHCTFQGADVWGSGFDSSPMQFSLAHDESEKIQDLPAGAVCVVSETDAHGADSTTVDVQTAAGSSTMNGTTSNSITLTPDNPNGTNTAVVNNNFGVTSFTVAKALAGAGAAQFAASSFTISVVCSAPGVADAYDKDVTLPTEDGAWNTTINNLPQGSICSAIELGDRSTTGADTESIVDSDGGHDGLDVPTAPVPGKVTITNWYLTGSLSVTKKVIGDGGADFGSGRGQFEIELACTRDDVNGDSVVVDIPDGGTREISADGTAEFDHLPSGAICTLQETDNGGATASVILDHSGNTVASDATKKYTLPAITVDTDSLTDDQAQSPLTIQNTFDNASLTVTKHVDSSAVDELGQPVAYGPFPVSVKCTFPTAATTVYDSSKNLTKDEDWTIPALPAGASCAVTETDTMSAADTSIATVTGTDDETLPDTDSATVTLAPTGTNSVAITNAYRSGNIQVSKVVTGDGAATWGNGPFTIGVSCTLTDASGTRSVWNKSYSIARGGDPISIDNLATGADCTVNESKTVGANSTTIAVGTSEASAETSAEFTSPAPAADLPIVVTNRFDESSVDVTKNRIGDGAALYGNGPFEVSLSCTRPIDGADVSFDIPGGATRTLDADDRYLATYDHLPAGASCVPTETEEGGANSHEFSSDNFTTDAGTPTDLQLDNTFNVGGVTITKTILGDGSLLYGNGPFEVSLACTRSVNGASVDVDIPGGATRELTGENGYIASYENLPEGANCVPTETKTHGANASDFDASSVTVAKNVDTNVGLSNTFETGSVVVNNLVTGGDGKRHFGDTFTEVLVCTQDIDGVKTPVDIPGGAERDIWNKTTITYDDLPVGATCILTESQTNEAQVVTITWHGMPIPANSVVVANPTTEQIAVVNVFNASLAFTGENILGQLALSLIVAFVGGILLLIRRRREKRAD